MSLDGASQESYSKYRAGGNFHLVLKNVRRLSEAKKRLGRSKPKLIWKFIIFQHNKHETDDVKKLYKEYGFDGYEFVPDKKGEVNQTEKKIYIERSIKKKKNCFWLWQVIVIQSDGQINPCCNGKNFNIGNAFDEEITVQWNNPVYKKLRSAFRGRNFVEKLHKFCGECFSIHKNI